MGWICANCGKIISIFKGSEKHPYCKKCFKEIFNNDDKLYMAHFQTVHPLSRN